MNAQTQAKAVVVYDGAPGSIECVRGLLEANGVGLNDVALVAMPFSNNLMQDHGLEYDKYIVSCTVNAVLAALREYTVHENRVFVIQLRPQGELPVEHIARQLNNLSAGSITILSEDLVLPPNRTSIQAKSA